VISVRVNPDSGLRDDSSNVSEFFFAEFPPAAAAATASSRRPGRTAQDVRDQLF
jgi:hypothetical protein